MKTSPYLVVLTVCLAFAGCKKQDKQSEQKESNVQSVSSAVASSSEGGASPLTIRKDLGTLINSQEVLESLDKLQYIPRGIDPAIVSRECSKLCGFTGRCKFRDGKCVAIEAAHCRASFACKVMGTCSMDDKGNCLALTEQDCKNSEKCQIEGACNPVDGRCTNISTGAADKESPPSAPATGEK